MSEDFRYRWHPAHDDIRHAYPGSSPGYGVVESLCGALVQLNHDRYAWFQCRTCDECCGVIRERRGR